MRLGFALAVAAVAAVSAFSAPASADDDHPRNCRPYNGPYGYYGNPWCTGGNFTDSYPGRTIWSWEGGQSYWWFDDPAPPRKAKRKQ